MKHFLLSALLLAAVAGCAKKQEDTPTPASTPQQLLLGTWNLAKEVYPVAATASRAAHLDSTLYSPASALYGITFQPNGIWLGGTGLPGTYNTGAYAFAPPALTYGNATGAQTNTETVLQLTAQQLVLRTQVTNIGLAHTFYYVK